jgi:hypothetical protein
MAIHSHISVFNPTFSPLLEGYSCPKFQEDLFLFTYSFLVFELTMFISHILVYPDFSAQFGDWIRAYWDLLFGQRKAIRDSHGDFSHFSGLLIKFRRPTFYVNSVFRFCIET